MKHTTNSNQDLEFAKAFGNNLFISTEWILDWVQENFLPNEVFDEDELIEWANEYDPQNIFEDEELERWAENADYVRPHDDYPEREL